MKSTACYNNAKLARTENDERCTTKKAISYDLEIYLERYAQELRILALTDVGGVTKRYI